MQLWLERSDLEAYSYSVLSSQESTGSGEISPIHDKVTRYLTAYADILKESEVPYPTEAIAPLEALLTYYPNHEALLIRLTYLRHKGETQCSERKALNSLNEILEIHPEHEAALKLSIDIHWKAGQFDKVLPYLTALIANVTDEERPFLLYRRAEAYHMLNQPLQALNDLERVLSIKIFLEAVQQRDVREAAANWSQHRLFSKQPIELPNCEKYGVIDEEYTTYSLDATYEACVALMVQIARAGYTSRAALSHEACDDERANKRARTESPGAVLNL